MLYTSSTNFPGKNYTSPPRDKETHPEMEGMLKLSWDGNYDRYVVEVKFGDFAFLQSLDTLEEICNISCRPKMLSLWIILSLKLTEVVSYPESVS